MREELVTFLQQFLLAMQDHPRSFTLVELERKYNIERTKQTLRPIVWSNHLRLIIVCWLLKYPRMHRTYKYTTNGVQTFFYLKK